MIRRSLPPEDHRGLTVETYHDPRALPALGWDEMVRAESAPMFYRSDYLVAYYDSPLALVDRFGYVVIRDGSVGSSPAPPVAVLPVALHRQPDPLGLLRLAHPGIEAEPALLSHVWHCYDTRLVGAVQRPEGVRAALGALRSLAEAWGARWYGLVNVARGSPTAEALTAAGLSGAHLVDRFTVDLTGVADLESYLARLGYHGRANLRRNARRAAETGFTTAVLTPAAADLTEIAELCARTAARLGSTGFYPTATFAAFVLALGPAAHVLEIRQRGRLVATGVCLVDEARFHTWTCGVDYDVSGNASPYAVLFAESVALALRLGRPILEGGRGNEVFKRRHGLSPLPLDAYVVPV